METICFVNTSPKYYLTMYRAKWVNSIMPLGGEKKLLEWYILNIFLHSFFTAK